MAVRINRKDTLEVLKGILEQNADKRIVVVGTTCAGKSTLIAQLKADGFNAQDMDELLVSRLSKSERDAVNQTPWTTEIGELMEGLAKSHIGIAAGEPVFGTVVFDCDLLVYLKVSDDKLRERIRDRGVKFEDAKNMQERIEEKIRASRIRCIEIAIGA